MNGYGIGTHTRKTAEHVFAELASKKMVLDMNGIAKPSRYVNHTAGLPINPESDAIKSALRIIPLLIVASDRKMSVNSYAGKHVVEKVLECGYISNGEFILCMLMLGYKWKLVDECTSQNAKFYAMYSNSNLMTWLANSDAVPKF